MSRLPAAPAVARPTRTLLALGLVTLGLVACGDNSTPSAPVTPTAAADAATTAQITQDVATDAGDATATLNETLAGAEVTAGSFADAAPATPGLLFESAPSTTCSGPDAAGWFTCAKSQDNGFGVTRMLRYWSGGSYALRYSEATTDSVNHRWTLSGGRVTTDSSNGGTSRTARANRADTATMQVVRGATPQHVWNGVGARTDTSAVTDKNGTRSYVVTAFDTTRGVAYGQPRRSYPWPLAGSVTHAVRTVATGVKGATVTTTRRAVVSFNGTQTATIQVGALTCALDLKTHQTSNCH